MASVCYHSFCRRQRLRPPWCWLLVPSGCWMWLGKEWRTTKTTALCTAKVNARSCPSFFGRIETWELQNSTKRAGIKFDPLFLFLLRSLLPVFAAKPGAFYNVKPTVLCHELLGAIQFPNLGSYLSTPSLFCVFSDGRFEEIPDSSHRHYLSRSKFLVTFSTSCQGVCSRRHCIPASFFKSLMTGG